MKTKENIKTTSDEFITKSLLKLLNDKDYSDIDVSLICHKAGVSRVTFYRYFSSKEDVMSHYFKKLISPFMEEMPGIHKQKDFLSFFEAYYLFLESHYEVFQMIDKSKLDYLILNYLNDALAFLVKNMDLAKNPFLSYYIAGALYNSGTSFIRNRDVVGPKKLAQSLYDFCFAR